MSPGYLRTQDDADRYVDGYYRTGDIGSLDEQGFLTIKGRIKNLIVTSHGKNIAPEPWERSVMAEPVVGEAIVVGDGRPYATALIVLDTDEAIAWARRLSFADLARSLTDAAGAAGSAAVRIADERVVSHVQRAVDLANAAVSRAEQVRRFAVLVTAVPASDPTITPTLKRRRAEFLAAMAPHIASLYPAKDRP